MSKETDKIVALIGENLNSDPDRVLVHSFENPMAIEIGGATTALYIRKITSAYFKNRPDVTSVQLHDSSSIKDFENQGIKVLILGYCPEFNCVILWPPESINSRFNKRKNVSLYSRKSFQKEAGTENSAIRYRLKNADTITGFPLKLLSRSLEDFLGQQSNCPKSPTLFDDEHQKNERDGSTINSEALTEILKKHPSFSFADAVEHLMSKRKAC
jgi:hypothetical protein